MHSMVHAEKLGTKSNKAQEVEEELGFGEEGLQWMYVFPANSQQKPEEVKEEAILLFLGNRKSGRGKDGSKPCFGSMIYVFKEELEDQVTRLMGGERSKRFFKEQKL